VSSPTIYVSDAHVAVPSDENQVSYKVASSPDERAEAFGLVYKAYLRAGLIDENPFEMRVTPHHLLPTTDVFLAQVRGVVISTVSLVADGELGLPMESIYRDELAELRGRGGRLAEVTSLADRRRYLSRTLPVFVSLMRLLGQSARKRGIDRLLVAVHPRHAKFYQRFLKFEALGGQRSYPLVRNNPAVALTLDFERLDRTRPLGYEVFFGDAIADEQLRPWPMCDAERQRFEAVAAYGMGFTPVGPSDHTQGGISAGAA
jgi:hypothetical protein